MKKTSKTLLLILTLNIIIQFIPMKIEAMSLQSKGSIVIDHETGRMLYGKDPDTRRVMASMSKIMTAYIIFEELEAENITLNTKFTVDNRIAKLSTNPNYPAAIKLNVGEQIPVNKLLQLILVPSASAACELVAENISGSVPDFVKRMNTNIHKFGLDGHYVDPHGIGDNTMTPRSVAKLTSKFIKDYPEVLEYTGLKEMEHNGRKIKSTNKIIRGEYTFPGIDGFKTGTTRKAGFCNTATASRDGNRVISVVMGSSNNKGRFGDSIKNLDYGFKELEKIDQNIGNSEIKFTDLPKEIRQNTDFNINIKFKNLQTDLKYPVTILIDGEIFYSNPNELIKNNSSLNKTIYIKNTDKKEVQLKFKLGDKKSISETIKIINKKPANFRDIDGHFAEESINKLNNLGLISGINENYFNPNDEVSVGMFVTMIHRIANKHDIFMSNTNTPIKLDNMEGRYYEEAVVWANERGLLDKKYNFESPILSQDASVILANFYRNSNNIVIEDIYNLDPYGNIITRGHLALIFDKANNSIK